MEQLKIIQIWSVHFIFFVDPIHESENIQLKCSLVLLDTSLCRIPSKNIQTML